MWVGEQNSSMDGKLESLISQYVVHQNRIKELSEEMKVERRVKKQIEADIVAALVELERDELAVNGHTFTIKRALKYSQK